jgi:CBS domain-containing protein
MCQPAIRIGADEPVAVAARTLAHYNIGALPVCGQDGRVCGMVTDRDMVTRCLAAGKSPERTRVREIMTAGVLSVDPETDVATAAAIMGKQQIRRLPVVEKGRLCGMLSLGDISREEIDEVVETIRKVVKKVRSISAIRIYKNKVEL